MPGDQARISCNVGFQIAGIGHLVCEENLSWSPQPPECVSVHCSQPPEVDNGVVQATGSRYKDKVVYTCLDGYEIRGRGSLFCSEGGSWKGDPPSCVPKHCGIPNNQPNMQVHYKSMNGYDHGYGSEAIFTCIPGYYQDLESVLKCTGVGAWEGRINPCKQIPCGAPLVPVNSKADIEYKDGVYSSVLTCLPGYNIQGQQYTTCLKNRAWETNIAECIPIDCGKPVFLPYGTFVGNETTFGHSWSLICDEEYVPRSKSEIQCTDSGVWNMEGVTCDLARCPELPVISHASIHYTAPGRMEPVADDDDNVVGYPVNTQARFNCTEGYQVTGENPLKCLSNQTWSHKLSLCQRVWCSALEPPVNGLMMGVGKQSGDIIRFACEEGYNLSGFQEIKCQKDGIWDHETPTCQRVWCASPNLGEGQSLPNQIQTLFPHSAKINLQCSSGFKPRGNLTVACQPSSKWTRPNGACHRISCGRPKLDSGAIILSDNFVYGSQVQYSCNSGYNPVNSPLTCGAEGSWTPELASCKDP